MTPALPTRMRCVVAAIAAISTSGAVPTMLALSWCSGAQVAVVAERVAVPGERERFADGAILGPVLRGRGLVEDGELQGGRHDTHCRPSPPADARGIAFGRSRVQVGPVSSGAGAAR